MNYNRRANRPDANYYRETRRRGLKGESAGHIRRSRGHGWLLLLLVFTVIAALAGWLMWRGV
jgi:hypothetical protein